LGTLQLLWNRLIALHLQWTAENSWQKRVPPGHFRPIIGAEYCRDTVSLAHVTLTEAAKNCPPRSGFGFGETTRDAATGILSARAITVTTCASRGFLSVVTANSTLRVQHWYNPPVPPGKRRSSACSSTLNAAPIPSARSRRHLGRTPGYRQEQAINALGTCHRAFLPGLVCDCGDQLS
jgi:hypothetical protein